MEIDRSPKSKANGLGGPRIMALALLALGAVVFYATFQIRQPGGYSVVGPVFFPRAVALGLLALGALFLLRTTIRPDTDLAEQAAEEEAVTHWPTIGWTVLALVVYAFALRWLGYVVATTIFFVVMARILGSSRPLRDLLIGVVLSAIIYISFTRLLSVRLPAGLLDMLV
jgi:putative tricarboxylic transport membrane protein